MTESKCVKLGKAYSPRAQDGREEVVVFYHSCNFRIKTVSLN
jgi:hypothetical protein